MRERFKRKVALVKDYIEAGVVGGAGTAMATSTVIDQNLFDTIILLVILGFVIGILAKLKFG